MNADKIALLDKNVQLHNIGEEQHVGMVNSELSIKGEQNLDIVPRKLVLNRSEDLIQNKSMLPFTMYQITAKDIKEIHLQWSEKMNELKRKGFDAKDKLNVKKDAAKIKDLEYLKTQEIPESFTLNDDIDNFIESDTVSDIDKQSCLYVEARYTKATRLSMNCKTLNNFFKLTDKGKKLEYKSYAECLKKYLDISRSLNLFTIYKIH